MLSLLSSYKERMDDGDDQKDNDDKNVMSQIDLENIFIIQMIKNFIICVI